MKLLLIFAVFILSAQDGFTYYQCSGTCRAFSGSDRRVYSITATGSTDSQARSTLYYQCSISGNCKAEGCDHVSVSDIHCSSTSRSMNFNESLTRGGYQCSVQCDRGDDGVGTGCHIYDAVRAAESSCNSRGGPAGSPSCHATDISGC